MVKHLESGKTAKFNTMIDYEDIVMRSVRSKRNVSIVKAAGQSSVICFSGRGKPIRENSVSVIFS